MYSTDKLFKITYDQAQELSTRLVYCYKARASEAVRGLICTILSVAMTFALKDFPQFLFLGFLFLAIYWLYRWGRSELKVSSWEHMEEEFRSEDRNNPIPTFNSYIAAAKEELKTQGHYNADIYKL